MIRNTELKTVETIITSQATQVTIEGQVPAGMKRWVTFVKLDTPQISGGAESVGVYLASVATDAPTKALLVATGNRKMLMHQRATGVIGYRKTPLNVPEVPSVETPLFSIAAEKWLGVYATAATAMLSMQYFDE